MFGGTLNKVYLLRGGGGHPPGGVGEMGGAENNA